MWMKGLMDGEGGTWEEDELVRAEDRHKCGFRSGESDPSRWSVSRASGRCLPHGLYERDSCLDS